MGISDLVKRITDTGRAGITADLAGKLGLPSDTAVRLRLEDEAEQGGNHLGVYMLAIYVVDDTDFWGDGEIYWYSIPALVERDGKVKKSTLHGLPNGMGPHKCGSLEWMTNIPMADPPLLAVIPPADDFGSLVLRLCVYDDDGAAANFPAAMEAGFEALAAMGNAPLSGADQLVGPVREAIFKSLKAEEDDILVDQELILRRGESVRFGQGLIGSVMTPLARVYTFVKDEVRTVQFGPVALHKGQVETVKFDLPMKAGGRLALFSRGAEVNCATFGNLDTDTPFLNRIIELRNEPALEQGFNVSATGPAKLIAFYTPP